MSVAPCLLDATLMLRHASPLRHDAATLLRCDLMLMLIADVLISPLRCCLMRMALLLLPYHAAMPLRLREQRYAMLCHVAVCRHAFRCH